MNTWKILLATLVIFGAGVITGGLLVGYSDRAARESARRRSADRRDAIADVQRMPVESDARPAVRENRLPLMRKELLDQLNRELNLTPEQRDRIESIIHDGQQQTHDLWHKEMVQTRQRILAELNPDQQRRFQRLFKPRASDPRRAPARPRPPGNESEPATSTNSPAAP